MPNWEYTLMKVTFKNHNRLEEFKKKYLDENRNFDFDRVVPEPRTKQECPVDCIVENAEKAGIQEDKERPWFNWYTWHCRYWGTKWNACCSCVMDETQRTITIYYDTAWSHPDPIHDALKAQNPDAKFVFELTGEDMDETIILKS